MLPSVWMGSDWDLFIKGLTAVCNTCRKPFLCDRLKSSCFCTEPAKDSWHLFEGFSLVVNEGRWSSVSCATLELEPLMVPLRYAWSLESWTCNGELPEQAAETRWRVDFAHLDQTIRSDLFWVTLTLVCRLSRIIEGVVEFVSSCPCHICKTSLLSQVRKN